MTVDERLGEDLALGDVVELLLQDVLLDLLKVLNVLVVCQLQGEPVTYDVCMHIYFDPLPPFSACCMYLFAV